MSAGRRAAWLAMAAVLAGALAIGAQRDTAAAPTVRRIANLEAEIRCPSCEGQSVAQSDAAQARAVRDEISRRVRAGDSDGEIRSYLASRYGRDILLKPGRTGVAGLVWSVPVFALALAVAALAVAFWRWRRRARRRATVDDRALVEEVRRGP